MAKDDLNHPREQHRLQTIAVRFCGEKTGRGRSDRGVKRLWGQPGNDKGSTAAPEGRAVPAMVYPAMDAGDGPAESEQTANDSASVASPEIRVQPAMVYSAMDAGDGPAESEQTANDSASAAPPEIRVQPAVVYPAMDAGEEPAESERATSKQKPTPKTDTPTAWDRALAQLRTGGPNQGLGGNAVRDLLKVLVREEQFTLLSVKRKVMAFMIQRGQLPKGLGGEDEPPLPKPYGGDPKQMFVGSIFQAGAEELPEGTHPLNAGAIAEQHVKCCTTCKASGQLHETCYMFAAIRCIRNGWKPPVRPPVNPRATYKGNYQSTALYSGAFDKEMGKLQTSGMLQPVESRGQPSYPCPMGALLKLSDVASTLLLTGVKIVDQYTLQQANDQRAKLSNLNPVKVRVISDLKANGINDSTPQAAFQHTGSDEAIRMIRRGDYLVKGDVARYFNSFALARESWPFFCVWYAGLWWYMTRCCFGFKLCPYYCVAWAGEIWSWLRHQGIPCCFMTDDWLTRGRDAAEARTRYKVIADTLVSIGLGMADEKYEEGRPLTCTETGATGTEIVYLGILYNTLRMVQSFDQNRARLLLADVQRHLLVLRRGDNLMAGEANHLAGTLQWLCEVLQSGPSHTVSVWSYSRHLSSTSTATRARLMRDLEWWTRKLLLWERGDISEREYPILSASELQANPASLIVVQSDISGPDGLGYFYGALNCDDPNFVATQWQSHVYHSSHEGELYGLLHFLRHVDTRAAVVVWVTDSSSSAWSINKGRCHEALSQSTLDEIFEELEKKRLWIVALWLPREHNLLADYLSHLAVELCRDEIHGSLSDLERTLAPRGGPR